MVEGNASDTPAMHGTSLSQADLEPWLPDGPPVLAWVYALRFETALPWAEMVERLSQAREEISDCRAVEQEKRRLYLVFDRKQWGGTIRRDRGAYLFELSFRNIGKPWGSNHALFLLLESEVLGILEGERLAYELSHTR